MNYTKQELRNIRNRVWYQRFRSIAEHLREQGLTWKQIEAALNAAYGLIDNSGGFQYKHIAYSASTSLRVALWDARYRRDA